MMKFRALALAAPLVALLGACTTMVPAQPPALVFEPVGTCTEAIDFSTAIPITSETPVSSINQAGELGPLGTCLVSAAGEAPYLVYKLSEADNFASVLAGVSYEELRMAAARVETYNSSGIRQRSFNIDQMVPRVIGYSVNLRPRDNEEYLVFIVEPRRVGEMIDFTVRNPDYSEGLGNEDFDEGIYQRIFSYEGPVFVLTYFSEPEGEIAE